MFPGLQIECHYCYTYQSSSWCHISRGCRKSTTTICECSERYVENWKYFRFVVAFLKDGFAVNSYSIYLASLSSTSPKTYDYSLTLLGCEQHLPNWNYFRFFVRQSAIFISSVKRQHLGMWILLPLKRSTPWQHRYSSWNSVLICALETA